MKKLRGQIFDLLGKVNNLEEAKNAFDLHSTETTELDSEMLIIGVCVQESGSVKVVRPIISADDFSDLSCRKVFALMCEMDDDDKPIDLVTLGSELKKDKELVNVIIEASSRVTSGANLKMYAGLVKMASVVRSVNSTCLNAVGKIRAGDYDIFDIADSLISDITGMVSSAQQSGTKIVDSYDKLAELAKKRHDSGDEMLGEPLFGLDKMDRMLAGIEEHDCIVIGGDGKMGKSSLGTCVVSASIELGRSMYCWSGEMSDEKRVARLVAKETGIPYKKILLGQFYGDPDALQKFGEMRGVLDAAKIFLDFGEMSIPDMRRVIYHHYYEYNTKLFSFDRVGLFSEVINNQVAAYAFRTQVLTVGRMLANTLPIKLVFYSQLLGSLAASPGRRPLPHHFYGGSAVPANCTKSLLLYRPEHYEMALFPAASKKYEGELTQGKAELMVAHNNTGKTGSCLINFHGAHGYFSEPGAHEAPAEDVFGPDVDPWKKENLDFLDNE